MTAPAATQATARLGIVLVNWNRWADTIECLESVLRSPVPVHVVVVDNASADASLDHVSAWAAGTLPATAAAPAMATFSQPPVAKPLTFERFSAAELPHSKPDPAVRLSLIDSGGNLGFAGGNNVGLRYLLGDPGIDHVWLLNNDTVIAPDAIATLVAHLAANPAIGMCGTMVRYYFQPDRVQALGGSRFNLWSGQSAGIGAGTAADQPHDAARVLAETDFVLGASLVVSRAFLTSVGLMEERYFLYFEEIDWATRNRGRHAIGFAGSTIVYHKEGGSIGSSGTAGARSALSEYWLTRSRLRYIRLHHWPLLPWHWLLTLWLASRRLLRRQPAKAAAMLRALAGIEY